MDKNKALEKIGEFADVLKKLNSLAGRLEKAKKVFRQYVNVENILGVNLNEEIRLYVYFSKNMKLKITKHMVDDLREETVVASGIGIEYTPQSHLLSIDVYCISGEHHIIGVYVNSDIVLKVYSLAKFIHDNWDKIRDEIYGSVSSREKYVEKLEEIAEVCKWIISLSKITGK